MLFGTGGTVSLSVTSRLMSARLCSRKAESVYDVRCCKTREYDGFAGGEFVDPEAAGALAKELLTAAAEETRPRTKTVYVGVPGEFGMSVCRDVSVMLDRSRRIVDADTAYLAEKGRGAAEDGYLFIGDSPVCYRVDASGGSYFDVRGMKGTRIDGTVTYFLAREDYASVFTAACAAAGFPDVRFVFQPWAECMTLLGRDKRAEESLLVDVGYLSTSLSAAVGDGLAASEAVCFGGGHIAAGIYEVFGVSFGLAERAKELLDLNLAYSPADILVADGSKSVHAAQAAELVREALSELADEISSFAARSGCSARTPVGLTGEGITSLRGADKFLSERTGRTVEICAPTLAGLNKPAFAAEAALVIMSDRLASGRDGSQAKDHQRR
ncbi:MAG TPA: hypothetical protein IAC73_00500 [Candidatus Limadaptatus stercoripullorum]|uniref:SHS2 domain-containing protein n=1 Tax=Candidatus Limadaptatus stercoripullorum TaxID=2840846 RepID=A0A9D1N8N1_9FIRM|nr:hypothetical protein [Candidatus Limadaptatus stercoripullorum]